MFSYRNLGAIDVGRTFNDFFFQIILAFYLVVRRSPVHQYLSGYLLGEPKFMLHARAWAPLILAGQCISFFLGFQFLLIIFSLGC